MKNLWKLELYPIIKEIDETTFINEYSDKLKVSAETLSQYHGGKKPADDVLMKLANLLAVEVKADEVEVIQLAPAESKEQKDATRQRTRLVEIFEKEGRVVINKTNYKKWKTQFSEHEKVDADNCWILWKAE